MRRIVTATGGPPALPDRGVFPQLEFMNTPASPPRTRRLPPKLLLTSARLGVVLTRNVLVVHVATQRLEWFVKRRGRADQIAAVGGSAEPAYELRKTFRCSTSRHGIGQVAGSNRTPLGLHRIAEKHGGNQPVGTIFRDRLPVGNLADGMVPGAITHRILWLAGLEEGFNRGGNVDTYSRFIYLHGTGDEATIGRPASGGCVHLAADDLIPLYAAVPVGTLVWIARR